MRAEAYHTIGEGVLVAASGRSAQAGSPRLGHAVTKLELSQESVHQYIQEKEQDPG